MITLYGIPNCDTVKKARAWLDAHGVVYNFHDYKKHGVDAAKIAQWVSQAGLDRVLNRLGTTYRKLPDEVKGRMEGEAAVRAMVANPSMIKRPIVEFAGGLLIGFSSAEWEATF